LTFLKISSSCRITTPCKDLPANGVNFLQPRQYITLRQLETNQF